MRYLLALIPLLALSSLSAKAQTVKSLIDTQNYVFVAVSVQPLNNSERRLTINKYTLKVTKNEIVSTLPYMGRMNAVPSDDVESALAFTSDKFSYSATPTKKDGWRVSIKPKDARNLDQIKLTINSDGFAVVQAIFDGLDPVSFTGSIVAVDSK